jgi:membrane protein required for colicin V production
MLIQELISRAAVFDGAVAIGFPTPEVGRSSHGRCHPRHRVKATSCTERKPKPTTQQDAMNPFDILTVVIFAYSAIRGIFRGLIKEMASIVGVLAGYYAAYSYYDDIAALLLRWVTNTVYLNIASFLILFCVVFLIVSAIGVIIKYVLRIAFLGWLDRICGALFGMAKAVLIAAVLLIVMTVFLPQNAPLVKSSVLAPHVITVSEKMVKVVPKEMKQKFSSKLEALKKSWKISP